ncbi:MAG: Hsp20/alpha crystallin family protein [Sphingobacteriaceae bacterium]|jgi:HSP20 family protein
MSLIKKQEKSYPSVFSDLFDYDKFFGGPIFKDFENALPATNVKETDKEFKIELAVPGFKKEDFKVNLDNEVLTISAETKSEKKDENEKFTRKEFSYNSFSRSFQLPKSANAEKINAKYEDGILKVDIIKKDEAIKQDNKKQIQVG